MDRVRRLANPVKDYAWGSSSAIAALLGEPVPSAGPQAELWMGAHPLGPSLVETAAGRVPLDEWIRRDPRAVLGARVAERFGAELPFLFKVLAAAKPLSIQAHPDLEQAREGFRRENEAGIPVDDARRSYRDPNHKPELICALTPFWALSGFRSPAEVAELVGALGVGDWLEPEAGLERLLTRLLTLPAAERKRLVGRSVEAARRLATSEPAFDWVVRLGYEFPDDAGVLAPLVLNLVRLSPGQATSLPARCLHAYLDGTGIEIMASSDNVLRGGLTAKHVDVDELLRVLDFEPGVPDVRGPVAVSPTESVYEAGAGEFALAVIRTRADAPHEAPADHGVEILLCTEGGGVLTTSAGGVEIERGTSLLVPASASAYRVRGEATLYRASVPA